jgi:two-component system response regulator MprA
VCLLWVGADDALARRSKERAMTQCILIVEDEVEIANYLRRGLAYEGFAVEVVGDGVAALAAARARRPDLVVLDLMLPGLDGMEVARRLRGESNVPIIILTARESVADRVMGLESGADDYMPKPFAFEELLARIHVQLRRRSQNRAKALRLGPLTLNVSAHDVTVGEHQVILTAKEFELLELFMQHPHQVLTRAVIYDWTWGYDFGGDSNVIEVYIHALRQKLESTGAPRLIHTVRGVGYILREEA